MALNPFEKAKILGSRKTNPENTLSLEYLALVHKDFENQNRILEISIVENEK
jgi:hypothetical protein